MELTSIIGLVLGFGFILFSIVSGGDISSFFNIDSIMIVVGGTLAATIVSYPIAVLRKIPSTVKKIFDKNEVDLTKDIEFITDIANIARREGLLALDAAVEDIENPFMKKGIMLIVDGVDTEMLKDILETEIYFSKERHEMGRTVMKSMASYAPAFGLIGTLIGLINMLQGLSDPETLGPSMAVALMTTFYGSILANLIFNPIAKKLEVISADESMQKSLFLEGLISIQEGENTRIIKDKLNSFISHGDIDKKRKADIAYNETAEIVEE